MSPPERKKHSPMFDLAMAIGILKAMGKLTAPVSPDAAFLGSLSLDGAIQPVNGMLPAILAAKKLGFQKVYLPYDPTLPLHHLKDLDCIFVQTLVFFASKKCRVLQYINSFIPHKNSI
ncbi:hypothetical protein CA592_09410 [Anoxybacillus flavithermus]|nr:magnesium chelatase domain-containing protein [Anoxybacillus flavithermus]ASA97006.1 hypothetical protein CA592_09410 [Anoxybacillus flavithermus]